MTTAQLTISTILLITLVLFAWGKYRHDIVAIFCLVMATVAGVVPADDAFSGFGHAAVITVAAVLIISHALKNAGVVTVIASYLTPFTGNIYIHIASLTCVVTVASAFMNNVGALALMLPVAIATANQANRSPALILMPLAFGSILGGMTTLIGTPPNIIIASYRAELTGQPFSMFDFSAVGFLVAIVGLAFITLIGWRLIPADRSSGDGSKALFEISHYLTEIEVKPESSLIGEPIANIEAFNSEQIDIVGFAQKNGFARPLPRDYQFTAGDILLVQGDPAHLQSVVEEHALALMTSASNSFVPPESDKEIMLEGVVGQNSPLVDRSVEFLRVQTSRTLALVGIARNGETITTRLKRQRFSAGDVLLVFGNADSIDSQFHDLGLWPLAKRPLALNRQRQVVPALMVFAGAIALGVAGVVTLPIAFLMAIGIYILMNAISVREIYDEIDWPVIVLLGAMIPVGRALESTGTTDWMANVILQVTEGLPAAALLAMVLIVTMFLSDIINNAATALVMAPIGVAIATSLGVSSDAFLMAVAVGASCAFLTPIGHQSNTLVMGPGGYHFGDYWRMGLPLEIIIICISVPLLLIVWPL
ncbi:potassium transporter TrkA [Chromatiales bacterium (ex Bugula neritina AB1)]|nr:potassium transporter TrkA [Chromatiales bacterium (ex Bugula neritina AB1)]